MSTQRPQRPAVPEQLPGEEELSQLYQQIVDEQPAGVLDETVLTTARRAVRSKSLRMPGRFLAGWNFAQIARRFVFPYALAAALLVVLHTTTSRIGTNLETRSSSIPTSSQVSSKPLPSNLIPQSSSQPAIQGQSPSADQSLLLSDEGATQESRGVLRKEQDKAVMKQEKEAVALTGEPLPIRPRAGMQQKELDRAVAVPAEVLTPEAWLAQISDLFRAGKQEEAEASLKAFQQRYPSYANYPDSFPKELLDRLRSHR
jgi:hypothetical protein